eukprot:211210-Pleurochrysis_carterae.AAC.1
MMQAHYDNGLAENTLAGFNAFYHEYDRFNRSLPSHQRLSDGVSLSIRTLIFRLVVSKGVWRSAVLRSHVYF